MVAWLTPSAPTRKPGRAKGDAMSSAWVEERGSVTVVHVARDDRAVHGPVLTNLREFLLRCGAEADPPILLVDLANARVLGSEFIGILHEVHHAIDARQGRLALCSVRPEFAGELQAGSLDSHWELYTTRDEAVEALERTILCSVP